MKTFNKIMMIVYTFIVFLCIYSACSCTAIKEGMNDHHNLYYETKAMLIVGQVNNNLVLENFTRTRQWTLKVWEYAYEVGECPELGDTLILKEHPYLWGRYKFVKDMYKFADR